MEDINSPFQCPGTVTVRRNPHRKARPTPLTSTSAAPPATALSSKLKDIPSCPLNDILSIQTPSRIKSNTSSALPDTCQDSLKVFLRIRPLRSRLGLDKLHKLESAKNVWPKNGKGSKNSKSDKVKKTKSESCIVVRDANSIMLSPPLALQDSRRIKSEVYEGFSHVFSTDASQVEVYERMVNPLVDDFLAGKSGMLLALGPSGSGKTHTMFGSPRDPGMIPLALRRIFQPINKHNHDPQRPSLFYISIFEIRCEFGKGEKIVDLSPGGNELTLSQSTIMGLQEVDINSLNFQCPNSFITTAFPSEISDVAQAESVIAHGMLKRATSMTNINNQSSRSQCVINIRCAPGKVLGEVDFPAGHAVLTIIDLAGAEREKSTGIQGKRLGESNFINNTSMVLGLCLRSLLEHQKNPKKPLQKHFQASLLTKYLRDHLEGKKRMTLILTVKSEEEDYSNTSFLLRQASPFAKIKFSNTGQQLDSLCNKRQLQVVSRLDQPKRIKVSGSGASEKEEAKESEIIQRFSKKEKLIQKNIKIDDKTSPGYNKQRNRYFEITQNLGKAIWKTLKEYKCKLQVIENEVQSLRESLKVEKTKNAVQEKELKDLRASCICSRQSGENIHRLPEVEAHGSKNFDENDAVKSLLSDASLPIHDIKECKSLIRQDTGVCQLEVQADRDPRTPKDSIKQINEQAPLKASSSEKIISDFRDMEQKSEATFEDQDVPRTPSAEDTQQIKDQVQSPNIVNSIHLAFEDLSQRNNECIVKLSKALDLEDCLVAADLTAQEQCTTSTTTESHTEVVKNVQDLELLKTLDCPAADLTVDLVLYSGSGSLQSPSRGLLWHKFSEIKASPSKPVVVSDDSCSTVELDQSVSEDNEEPLDDLLSSRTGFQANNRTCTSKSIQQYERKFSSSKPSTVEKPKRRLLPASIILRDMSFLEFEDENEKPKVNRYGNKLAAAAVQGTKRTTGSTNLLRLLKGNLNVS